MISGVNSYKVYGLGLGLELGLYNWYKNQKLGTHIKHELRSGTIDFKLISIKSAHFVQRSLIDIN